MINFKKYKMNEDKINEAKKKQIGDQEAVNLAINGKHEELREHLNNKYGVFIPVIDTIDPKIFENKYNKLLTEYKKDIEIVFNIFTRGVGRGEVLCVYLNPYSKIGGGSESIDLKLGKHKIEIKELLNVKNNTLFLPFLGAETMDIQRKIIKDLKDLFQVAQYYIDYLKGDNSRGNSIQDKVLKQSEIGFKVIDVLREFDPSSIALSQTANFKIDKNGNVYTQYDNTPFTNLDDKDLTKKLKELSSINMKKIKSMEEIDQEAEKLKNLNFEWFLFDPKTYKLYYRSSLSNFKVIRATLGKVNFAVE
jgi:hypothetical protein